MCWAPERLGLPQTQATLTGNLRAGPASSPAPAVPPSPEALQLGLEWAPQRSFGAVSVSCNNNKCWQLGAHCMWCWDGLCRQDGFMRGPLHYVWPRDLCVGHQWDVQGSRVHPFPSRPLNTALPCSFLPAFSLLRSGTEDQSEDQGWQSHGKVPVC